MKGKIKALTRFNKFKTDMLIRFGEDSLATTDLMLYLKSPINMGQIIKTYCDETETLHYLHSSPPTAIYQVFRMVDKPILLRELEVLGERIWGEGKIGRNTIYTALFVLYSINLIDYKFREFISTPSNIVQFFIKEEN